MLSLLRAQVQSLVGELESPQAAWCGKKKKNTVNNDFYLIGLLRGLNRIICNKGLKQFMMLAAIFPPLFLLCHDYVNIPTPGQVSFCFLCLAFSEDPDGCLFL